jgi:hypothetical protein
MKPEGAPDCHCCHDKCHGLRDPAEFDRKCRKCQFYKFAKVDKES